MSQIRLNSFKILPTIIKNLIIINTLVFIAQNTFTPARFDINLNELFALHSWDTPYFHWWQIVTHMFMHGSFTHLLFNMLTLWMFGSMIENIWGDKRFLLFYFLCGFCSAIVHLIYLTIYDHSLINQGYYVLNNSATLGASGAIAGIIAAFIYYFPNSYIYLYFFIPVKAKWLGILYFAYELVAGLINSPDDNVAHWAHLGGGLGGYIMVVIWNKNKNNRNFY